MTHVTRQPAPTRLLLIVGPIAAGKSTIARALTASWRAAGQQVALVELDTIADMARPTLPDWADVHRIFASVTAQWLEAGLDLVIAEGPGSRHEIEKVRTSVPAGTPVVTVVLTSSFETALSRALSDPTRGISRQQGFLSQAYRRWAEELPRIEHDLLLDTDISAPEASLRTIRSLVDDGPMEPTEWRPASGP